tara:strand:- start:107 stop:370 length:264 start_codon:yes stop_codon:yes gene_type:complete
MLDGVTQSHLDNIDDLILLEPRDTYDRAIVGVASKSGEVFVVYSNRQIVDALMETESWSEDDSIEWLLYNVLGVQAGDKTPAFIADI